MAEPALIPVSPARARSKELAAALALMKATLQATTHAILVTSNAFEVTDYNDHYLEMWSLPASVVDSLDHDQLIVTRIAPAIVDPEPFIVRIRSIYMEAPATTTADTLELLDGRVIQRHSSPQVVDGKVVGRVWSFADVTEVTRVERALLEETHVLEWLNEVGRDLTSTLEPQAVAQAATDAATKISGAKFGSFLPNRTMPFQDLPPLFSRAVGAAGEFLGNVHHPALADATQDWQQPFHCDDLHADEWGSKLFPATNPGVAELSVRSVYLIPVMPRPGVVLGTLAFGHDAPGVFTDRVKRLLGVMAAQAAVAIDNARLHSQVQLEVNDQRLLSRLQKNSADRLQSLTRRLMDAEEQERKRLGRELHDQVGANLSALLLGLALVRKEVPHDAASLLGKRLADFESLLHDTMGHVRDVLADLRPTALDELGLLTALRHQAAVLTARSGVAFSVHGTEPSPRLPPECEIALYRIAHEAWTNVLKHAEATRVTLTLVERSGTLSMLIEDDGKGFEPADRVPGSPTLGLTTMRERAEAIGAVIELDASSGAGVHLSLHLPRAAGG